MGIIKTMQRSMIWMASLVCLFAGLYYSINHTLWLFAPHNYLLGPIGDEAIDSINVIYPILLGKKSFLSIFQIYGDHRIVVERLQAMAEFFFANGTQFLQPYRLSLLLWLNCLLFVFTAVYPSKQFMLSEKLIILGVFSALSFAGVSLPTYGQSMGCCSWPLIFLCAILTFFLTENYCKAVENNSSSLKLFFYIFLVFSLIEIAAYGFAIGLMLWPVVFIILIKRHCLKKHIFLWVGLAIFSFVAYNHEGGSGQSGYQFFLQHPINMFVFMSQIVSLPIIPTSMKSASISSDVIGFFVISFSLLFILKFLRKRPWTQTDSILFSYLLFSFLSVLIISITRFGSPAEAENAARFTMPSLFLIVSLVTSFCYFQTNKNEELLGRTMFSMVMLVYLVALFIPKDLEINPSGIYSAGVANQFFIAIATGIPIDKGYTDAITPVSNERDPKRLTFLDEVQRKNKKSIYSLWQTPYINHSLSELNFKEISVSEKADVLIQNDFRRYKNPGLLLMASFQKMPKPFSADWDVFFSNSNKVIIGFALTELPTSPKIMRHIYKSILWQGAINTDLVKKDKQVLIWAVNKKDQLICKIGETQV